MNVQRNLVLAVLLSALVLFGWDFAIARLYPPSTPWPDQAERIDAPPATGVEAGVPADRQIDLATALAVDRVAIDAPGIAGSINPVGARIDDVLLKDHRATVAEDSGSVRLFSPPGTPARHFAQFGWVGEGVEVPDARTVWLAAGGPLAPGSPVVLTWNNRQGQLFRIELSIDAKYLITARQTVRNAGEAAVVLRPYAFLSRTSRTASPDSWNVHSGPIGAFAGSVDFGWDYDDVAQAGTARPGGEVGWLGFTDIYWLSALIPQAGAGARGAYRSLGGEAFRADVLYRPVAVPPGAQVTRTTALFAGAKETEVLDAYERAGIAGFGLAIDWGWFRWFEKPIFWLLRRLDDLVGNFGLAIVLLTLIMRLAMYPIAQRQFASTAAMRAIQPRVKELQERYHDDKPRAQQEIMALYKSEGANPLAGCLPVLLQFPIFFALYKVLLLAIEMRHEPFVLWLDDLSVPDPATILNLFGLLPFTPPGFLAIGVLAALLGFTMWLTMRLGPQAMDPVQRQVFMIMPWVVMFAMAPFAAGLLLYWITSNILSVAQQRYLYSKHPQPEPRPAPSDGTAPP